MTAYFILKRSHTHAPWETECKGVAVGYNQSGAFLIFKNDLGNFSTIPEWHPFTSDRCKLVEVPS